MASLGPWLVQQTGRFGLHLSLRHQLKVLQLQIAGRAFLSLSFQISWSGVRASLRPVTIPNQELTTCVESALTSEPFASRGQAHPILEFHNGLLFQSGITFVFDGTVEKAFRALS
jgi:hypothetical protein